MEGTRELAFGKIENIVHLTEAVLQRHSTPEDQYEIAAIMESLGWNDRMVNETFGCKNVFSLAVIIMDAIQKEHHTTIMPQTKKLSPMRYIVKILRSFLRGSIFALPMAVSVGAMLTLRFSIWSYKYFSLQDATSISIATIFSFATIGGFTQAIARRGFLYIGQDLYTMARRSTYYFIKIGYYVCITIAVAFALFNFFFSLYPWRMVLIILLYFLFLSSIWLSVTVMYVLQKELVFTGIITLGIALVLVFFRLFQLNIMVSQIIALFIVSLLSTLIGNYYFLRTEQRNEKGIDPPFPRQSVLWYTSFPYFVYGFAYFTYLHLDRVLAWSTDNAFMPYPIWFRGEYELGLDFALLVLILPMGFVEVVVNEIMANLLANQKIFSASDASSMNHWYSGLYKRRFVTVSIFSVLSAVILFLVIQILSKANFEDVNILATPITKFVFIWAVISYCILALGLMNSLILFSLSQPGLVFRPMLWGLIIDLCLGFVLSRWGSYYWNGSYHWAVIGLFAGAVVFTWLTSRRVLKVLNHLDYYLYAAM